MNTNIDLTKILKDCPKGTKLYSTVYGEVTFISSSDALQLYPISVRLNNKMVEIFTSEGKLLNKFDGECTLFPSKEQRDWNKFTAPWYKKDRFDPNTLKPFDKVLVRNNNGEWECAFFSHIKDYGSGHRYHCCYMIYRYCIPYNEDTKHLVGTTEEAPEYYRYWEE